MADLACFQRLVNPVRTEPKGTHHAAPRRAVPSPQTAAAMRCFLPRAPAAVSISHLLPLAPLQPPSSPSPGPAAAPLLWLWASAGSRSVFQLLEPAEAAISLVINPAAVGCAPVSVARGGLTAGGEKYTLPGWAPRMCVLLGLWGLQSD